MSPYTKQITAIESTSSGRDQREVLLADMLSICHEKRKTGAVYVVVKQSKEYLVRFYFRSGEIYRVSYGPLKGQECLELLDCYDFRNSTYIDGMKAPSATRDIPETEKLISLLRSTGKTVQMDRSMGPVQSTAA